MRDDKAGENRLEISGDAAILAAHYEEENARFARILHDGPAQKLTAAMIELSLWKSDLEEGRAPTSAAVQELAELLQSVSSDMRDVSSQLRPRALDLFGISAVIESMAAKRSRCRFQQPSETITMDCDAAIQLIRIAETILGAIDSAAELEMHFEQDGLFALLHFRSGVVGEIPTEAAARTRAFGGTIERTAKTLTIRLLRSLKT